MTHLLQSALVLHGNENHLWICLRIVTTQNLMILLHFCSSGGLRKCKTGRVEGGLRNAPFPRQSLKPAKFENSSSAPLVLNPYFLLDNLYLLICLHSRTKYLLDVPTVTLQNQAIFRTWGILQITSSTSLFYRWKTSWDLEVTWIS